MYPYTIPTVMKTVKQVRDVLSNLLKKNIPLFCQSCQCCLHLLSHYCLPPRSGEVNIL